MASRLHAESRESDIDGNGGDPYHPIRMHTQSRRSHLTDTAVLDRLPVAVCVCDRRGRIVRFNDQAAAVWGRTPAPDDCYCGSARMLRPDGTALPHAQSPVAAVLATGEAVRDVEILIERPDASRMTVVMHVVPVLDDAGALVGAVNTFQDVTTITRAAAQEGSRAKDDVLATVAHELRQPIHAAAAALKVMALRPGREPGAKARATIERQIQQMNRIVEDLLDAERIVHGKVELRPELMDLRTTVQEVLDAFAPVLAERHQEFRVELPDAPIPVHIDDVRMQQVLMNVVTNASKYTDPGGRVSVTVAGRRHTADITIADTGRGIDPSALSRIFDPFARAAEDSGGFGVGLAVARQLVELHGGRIYARSAGRGQGSEFVISLPTATAE